jgi:hypothetical protein
MSFTHPVPEDVDLLLVSPTGQKYVPFAFVAGIVAVSNINLTLDDAAASLMPSTGSLPGGTYRPSAFANATFLSPAPSGPLSVCCVAGLGDFYQHFFRRQPERHVATVRFLPWSGYRGTAPVWRRMVFELHDIQ